MGIGSSGQNLEAASTGPWLSRLCPFQVRWPAQSSVLRRCASGDLGILRRNPRLLARTNEAMEKPFSGVIGRFDFRVVRSALLASRDDAGVTKYVSAAPTARTVAPVPAEQTYSWPAETTFAPAKITPGGLFRSGV